jgi:hypothetical protein
MPQPQQHHLTAPFNLCELDVPLKDPHAMHHQNSTACHAAGETRMG